MRKMLRYYVESKLYFGYLCEEKEKKIVVSNFCQLRRNKRNKQKGKVKVMEGLRRGKRKLKEKML